MKVCNVCNNSKEFKEFRRDRNMEDGHKSTCKECVKKKKEEKKMEREERENRIYDEAFKPMRKLFKGYQNHFELNDEPLRVPKDVVEKETKKILESYGYDMYDYHYRFEDTIRIIDKHYGFYIRNLGNYYLLTKIVEEDKCFFDELRELIHMKEEALTFTVEDLYIQSAKAGTYLWRQYLEDQFEKEGLKIRFFKDKVVIL